MANQNVNPTRMELTARKKKLVTAIRGHKLLKDKRDELMRQFLDLCRENMALRKKVEEGLSEANRKFVLAKSGMDDQTLSEALMAPKQEVYLKISLFSNARPGRPTRTICIPTALLSRPQTLTVL